MGHSNLHALSEENPGWASLNMLKSLKSFYVGVIKDAKFENVSRRSVGTKKDAEIDLRQTS